MLADGLGGANLTRNASEYAAELIRQAILDGRLPAGSRLKEGDLAQELGISRTPIREALLILHTEGVVESTPNRGAVVRTYTHNELNDIYALRSRLEGFAAYLAASRISDEGLVALRESCDRFEALAPDDVEGLVRENLFFHNSVLEAAGSQRLVQMVRKVIELPLVYRSFAWYSPTQKHASSHYHGQLTTALEARDAELAELLMRAHVLAARETLAAHLALPDPTDLEGDR